MMYRNNIKLLLLLLWLPLILAACQSGPTTPEKPTNKTTFIHQDSTVYFAGKRASISMRASFTNTANGTEQSLVNGYKLQFRSIEKRNVSITQVSIIAGGKKISLNERGFLLPPSRGATLEVSMEDTRYITESADALLRFKYEGESQLMVIKNHSLSQFAP